MTYGKKPKFKQNWREPDKRTLKQQLAGDYNWAIFRSEAGVIGLRSKKIPIELAEKLANYHNARIQLIKSLRNPKIRAKYMKLNLENYK